MKTAEDRLQGTNGFKNGGGSSTRHKRLLKLLTIVYKAETAVKTSDDRLQGTNGCKNGRRLPTRHKRLSKPPTSVYKAQTSVKTTDDCSQGPNSRKNGRRSYTRHKRLENGRRSSKSQKRLLKRPTIVYKAQTAVKTSDECLQCTNVRKND